VRQPAGAGLRFQLAHRLRLDPHGAGLHDPGPKRAAIAIDDGLCVQHVPYPKLRDRLLGDGQVLGIKK
jgi:hypothetical protein